jgi:ribosomal protein S25
VFYWNNATLDTQKFFIEMGHPERSTLANFYHTIHMNKAKDGLCTMNLREVCQQARINPMYSQAIMSILLGEGIVERVKLERPLRVKPLTEPKTKATKNLLEKIVELGVRDEIDGFYEVDREFLGDQLSVQQGAITRNLRTLENQGVIRMHDPGGSKPLRVLKEIHEIDFKKLDNPRRDAIQRLKQAGEFYRTDDDKKHKFMETYFQSENEK